MKDDTKYYHPKDLGLKALRPRPEVFARCTVDTTLLVNGSLLVRYEIYLRWKFLTCGVI